jgi:hypothetical protein
LDIKIGETLSELDSRKKTVRTEEKQQLAT